MAPRHRPSPPRFRWHSLPRLLARQPSDRSSCPPSEVRTAAPHTCRHLSFFLSLCSSSLRARQGLDSGASPAFLLPSGRRHIQILTRVRRQPTKELADRALKIRCASHARESWIAQDQRTIFASPPRPDQNGQDARAHRCRHVLASVAHESAALPTHPILCYGSGEHTRRRLATCTAIIRRVRTDITSKYPRSSSFEHRDNILVERDRLVSRN